MLINTISQRVIGVPFVEYGGMGGKEEYQYLRWKFVTIWGAGGWRRSVERPCQGRSSTDFSMAPPSPLWSLVFFRKGFSMPLSSRSFVFRRPIKPITISFDLQTSGFEFQPHFRFYFVVSSRRTSSTAQVAIGLIFH
jgi:hypothetical protein